MRAWPRRIAITLGAATPMLLALPHTALAHDGVPPAPHDFWHAWHLDPIIPIGLLVAAAIYARGVERLWARAGKGRRVSAWRALSWGAGLLALFVALISPLHRLGEALFSAHMGQHLLLVVVAAPLLVLGGPLVPSLWALPPRYRRRLGSSWWSRIGRRFRDARGWLLPIGLLHIGVLWAWHAPALYEASLRSSTLHALNHGTLLGTALFFWWAVLPAGGRGGVQIPALFAMVLQGGALGGLILATGTPWYPEHAPWVAAWGLTPLADQQLAGLLMMLPGDAIYLGVALAGAAAWLRPRGTTDTRRVSPLPQRGES